MFNYLEPIRGERFFFYYSIKRNKFQKCKKVNEKFVRQKKENVCVHKQILDVCPNKKCFKKNLKFVLTTF